MQLDDSHFEAFMEQGVRGGRGVLPRGDADPHSRPAAPDHASLGGAQGGSPGGGHAQGRLPVRGAVLQPPHPRPPT